MSTNPKDPTRDPGKTPGKAEGERGGDPDAGLQAGEPGTPSQAEGDRETAEENLGERTEPRR